jgi:hypothetical protein
MTPLLLALGLSAPAQPPLPLPVPFPPQPVPAAPPAFTLEVFSRAFAPLPGKHEVWFVHPHTGQPVKVCFALPPGRLKKWETGKDWVEFQFEKCEVRLDFRKNGRVDVDHD